jgi:uncharacterized LabA/DUF88 family protein
MSDLTYVFVDGNYLRRAHRDMIQSFFGVDGELDIRHIKLQANATRVYVYDAIDDALGAGETTAQREQRVGRFESIVSQVRSLEGYHFRPGSVKKGKRREQKEVDVLLAVDMMTFGLTERIRKAVLISGDLDFRPAVEELVRHGITVHVWYTRTSFSDGLVEAADLGWEMRLKDLWAWSSRSFQNKYQIPGESGQTGNVRNGKIERAGYVAGRPAELYSAPSGGQTSMYWLYIDTPEENASTFVWNTDLDLIERYVTHEFGEIDWQMIGDAARAKKDRDAALRGLGF